MSRIQDILKKAEREGGVQRTRALLADVPPAAAASAGASAIAMPAPWTPAAREPRDTTPPPPARVVSGTLDPRLVAAFAPQSLAAEQYRSLRTRIKASENGRVFRSFIITSPNKGDGKSLTAANLALTMAQEFHQRVLLVDADLRRPSIHHLFGISETPGLTDVLMGGATVEEALVEIP